MADPLTNAILAGLSPELLLIISAAALILGLVLAFMGKLIWKPLMSIIGGFLGAILGFVIGLALAGDIGGIILAMIGGFIGGAVFARIVEFALAALAGIVAFVLLGLVTGNIIIAAVAGIGVLILCLLFIRKVIGLLMAIVGSLIAGVGMIGLGLDISLAAIAALAMMIVGSIVQTFIIKDRGKAAHERRCPSCGNRMVRDTADGHWYCPNCGFSEPPPAP